MDQIIEILMHSALKQLSFNERFDCDCDLKLVNEPMAGDMIVGFISHDGKNIRQYIRHSVNVYLMNQHLVINRMPDSKSIYIDFHYNIKKPGMFLVIDVNRSYITVLAEDMLISILPSYYGEHRKYIVKSAHVV